MSSCRVWRGIGFLLSLLMTLNALVIFPAMAADMLPVEDIEGVPLLVVAGESIDLSGTTVTPTDATNRGITWSIQDEGTTGATLEGSILSTTAKGTVTVTAAITGGNADGTPYIEGFSITVDPREFTAVEDVVDVPTTAMAGTPLDFAGTVIPENATNKTIEWSVKAPGDTGAAFEGNTFSSISAGTVTVTAIIMDGVAPGSPFTKDFDISVELQPFTAVTDITDLPTTASAGIPLNLTGTVVPENATNKTIEWSVKVPGDTGAAINENTLSTASEGTVIVTATITDGIAMESPYTKDFTVTVQPPSSAPFVPVVDIADVPTTAEVGVPLYLSGTVLPLDATNRAITWKIKDAGNTGAVIREESLLAEAPGKITLTASVQDGLSEGTPYEKDITVTALKHYEITDEPAEWSGTGDMVFTIDAPFADFLRLTMNGQEVEATHYDKAEGSTKITFKESYLETLTGKPLIRAEFQQGFAELWPLGGNVAMPLTGGVMSPDEDGIKLKLNGIDVPFSSDGKADIRAGDGDRIDFTLSFTESNGADIFIEDGDVFSIELPDIFDPLSEKMLDSATQDLMDQNVFKVEFGKNGDKQTVTITKGTKSVLNFIISFYAILDDIGIAGDVDEEIKITDSSTVHITTTPSASTAKDILGRPSPINTGSFTKGTRSHAITQAQLDEDSDIGNAWNYLLHVNTDLSLSGLTGTAEDTLPEWTRLFVPSAPGCDYYKDYREAFRSFEITYYTSNAKKDTNGQWYMDIDSGTADDYLAKIRAVESAQGRNASEVTAEPDPKIYISNSIASRLMKSRTGDNQEVLSYTSSFSIGYKIDPITNTASFYTINTYQSGGNGQGYAYVPSRSGGWQDSDDPCVPLYSNPDTGYVTRAEVVSETTIQEYDDPSLSNGWTEQTTSNAGGAVSFAYRAPGENTASFTLTVEPAADNDKTAQESFEVDFNVSDPANPLYGSKVTIKCRIYFNQGWLPQSTGVLEFTNDATYESSFYTATGEYTFTGGGSSAAITAEPKTVSHQYIAHNGGTILTYALPFRKTGADGIDIGDLRVYDSISQYLEIMPSTIRIKLANQYTGTQARYSAEASDVGLSATYNETNHQLFITNDLDDIDTSELITVEFQARVRQDVKYGTQITNTFAGRTVTTTVDHRLDIRKVDTAGNPITAPATFSVSYTTNSPNDQSPLLKTLLDTNGQVSSMTTSTTGGASLEYRLPEEDEDEDKFYLKLEETTPPSGYTGLNDPIWIEADRDSEGEMSYALANPLPTGLEPGDLIVNADGSVSLTVKNTTTPPGGGNPPGGSTPPCGGTPPEGGTPPGNSGDNNDDGDDDNPPASSEPPRFDLVVSKTVAGNADDVDHQKLFRFQIVNTGAANPIYGTGPIPLSAELSPGALQVTGNGIDKSRIVLNGQGNPTILLLRHNETATIQNLYGGFYQIAELDTAGYATTYSVGSGPEIDVTGTGGTRELYFSADAQVAFKNTVVVGADPTTQAGHGAAPTTQADHINPQTGDDNDSDWWLTVLLFSVFGVAFLLKWREWQRDKGTW